MLLVWHKRAKMLRVGQNAKLSVIKRQLKSLLIDRKQQHSSVRFIDSKLAAPIYDKTKNLSQRTQTCTAMARNQ